MAVSYVKFQRGSQTAYDALLQKDGIDENTLYFIYSEDSPNIGKLYLGLQSRRECIRQKRKMQVSAQARAPKAYN